MFEYKLQSKYDNLNYLISSNIDNNYLYKSLDILYDFDAEEEYFNHQAENCPHKDKFNCPNKNCECLIVSSNMDIPLNIFDNRLIFIPSLRNYLEYLRSFKDIE